LKLRSFLAFIAPSFVAMVLLIALPLAGVAWLAVHQSRTATELVEVRTEVPLFGDVTRETVRMVPQAVVDEEGRPVTETRLVGLRNITEAAQVEGLARALGEAGERGSLSGFVSALYDEISDVRFWSALEFTLIYTFGTTPFVLGIGLAVALGVNRMSRALKGTAVAVSLMPALVAPVVSSLAVYWLFIDGGLVPAALSALGGDRFFFLADKVTIRLVLLLYGIWFATPFAFIILYAGLQTVPQDTLDAATVDGAGRWQRLRYVIVPHLAPLFAVITLIHLMDAYRVFEPILVFGSRVFANSLQYLTYYTLAFEGNVHKAAAYALLTVLGVVVLLVPVLWRISREHGEPR